MTIHFHYMTGSVLFQQEQLFMKQLGVTVILQELFPSGLGQHNKTEIPV